MSRMAMSFFIVILISNCKTPQSNNSDLNQFFENSRRRPATAEEKQSVMHLDRGGHIGCTAFFVENTNNKAILGSATSLYDRRR